MDLKEKQEIVKQIRMLCELQYRKGFQQGYDSAKEGLLSSEYVQKWRIKGGVENYKKIKSPISGSIIDWDVLLAEGLPDELKAFLD
jgi:hypothetical protein